MTPELRGRFREALQSADRHGALAALARSLAGEGMAQLELYVLFAWYQQRVSPEDPSYEALVDTLDMIHGGPWAKGRGLFAEELSKAPASPAAALPETWLALPSGDDRLVDEARREIGPSHPLWRAELTALARRTDQDDVLFGLRGRPEVWLAHLTWSGVAEPTGFPRATRFPTMLDWFEHLERDEDAGE